MLASGSILLLCEVFGERNNLHAFGCIESLSIQNRVSGTVDIHICSDVYPR